jgi:hypothetical protein
MATRTATPNPTKADIVRLILVRELADAEKRLREVETNGNANVALALTGAPSTASLNLGRLRGEVAALTRLKTKVVAYLDRGDLTALV